MSVVLKIKRGAIILAAVAAGVLCVVFSDGARQGVYKGLAACGTSVIPSLFLFCVLSVFAVKSGILQCFDKITPVSHFALGLNGSELAVFLVSLVAGYPVGAALVCEMYKKGEICRKKAQRMAVFCVGAGPGFVISLVGGSVLGSESDGKRIFLATVLSSVLMAAVSGIVEKGREKAKRHVKLYQIIENAPQKGEIAPEVCLSDTFVLSVQSAATTMLNVSAFIVAFSGVLGVLGSWRLPPEAKKYGFSLLEVTSGVMNFGRNELYAVAFLVGFGGISVHLQIMSAARGIGLKYKNVLWSRTVHGMLSAVLVSIFDGICPRATETAAMGGAVFGTQVGAFGEAVGTTVPNVHGNPLSAAAMLLLGVTVAVATKKKKARQKTC